jgi:hypothetical protein
VITLYFGARLLRRGNRSDLRSSVVWAAISVIGGVYQIANGVSSDVFAASVIAALVAGVVSLVAINDAAPDAIDPRRICVNCGRQVARDRKGLCNNCGLPFDRRVA